MMVRQQSDDFPTLGYLLSGIPHPPQVADIPVPAVRLDSRQIRPGELFIAIDGIHLRGSDFIADAIKRGAAAILVDTTADISFSDFTIPVCPVDDLRFRTGIIASRFYGEPSGKLNVTGITGTNGKTSVAYYLAQALSDNGKNPVGSIGTLGSGLFGKLAPGVNTTPDSVTIHGLLAEFLQHKARHVVMEVSSHALEQGRTSGVNFNTAVFTNLSREHLDYHGDLTAYASAKKKLFAATGLENAVINIDDPLGLELAGELRNRLNVISYGIVDRSFPTDRMQPLVSAIIGHEKINALMLGISSPWGTGELSVPLTGRFNAGNILACLGVLCLQGVPFKSALQRLSMIQGVPGRLEYFGNESSAGIFVDYSHTPDALQQALLSLRRLCVGKLYCVFGCGGNRDKGKRPLMGGIAEQYADHVILTSDNPRNESADKIIEDIRSGMRGYVPAHIQPDRALAIQSAIGLAGPDDIVLIAGKGHETWQEIQTRKIPFSDRQLVRNLLEAVK